jgi:hypothetical protein
MSSSSSTPDLLPVLSRGKHRNPRRGACFMELASFLAGERWSDHPACTHPLLAEVARNVNDRTSDADRPLLARLIPSVVGLTTEDVRADARIALHCALVALPVAPQSRQRSLAVAVQACLRQAEARDDADAGGLRGRAEQLLTEVPDAARWAAVFAARAGLDEDTSRQRFRRHSGPGIVNLATRAISEAAVPSQDRLLRTVLEGAIEVCQALSPAALPAPVDPQRQREAWALTR